MSCAYCSGSSFDDHPFLFVWPGQRHALGKLLQSDDRLQGELLADRSGVRIARPAEGWGIAAEVLEARLTARELAETRVLHCAADHLDATGYAQVMMADKFIGGVRGRWLGELLEEGRLTSWFQPIVGRDGAVFGHEALARGTAGDGSVISPQMMLEAAGTPELLARFDRDARITAAREAHRVGLPGHLFVNFVPSTIYDPAQCLRTTVAAIRELDLEPEAVVFEVVESYRIDDMEHLKRIFDSYRAYGFGVALDDFGAGYATLEALIHLRPDYVKLDKDLARRCGIDPFCRRLVEELVRLAHDEHIQVIAEGVEDQTSFALLQDIGADLFQGYLFGRPAPGQGSRDRGQPGDKAGRTMEPAAGPAPQHR